MDWKEKLGTRLYKLWRTITVTKHPERKVKKFIFSKAFLWKMEHKISSPRIEDCTDRVHFLLKESKNCLNLSNLYTISNTKDCILEVQYLYRGIGYRILYNNGITFPPYQEESQTPRFRMFEKDFKSIEIELFIEIDDSSPEKEEDLEQEEQEQKQQEQQNKQQEQIQKEQQKDQEIEVILDEPDMNQLMMQLRGPGVLFHRDVPHACEWEEIKTWIKIFYLENTKLHYFENNVGVKILWSNAVLETF